MKRLSEHLKGSIVIGQEPPTPENSDEEASELLHGSLAIQHRLHPLDFTFALGWRSTSNRDYAILGKIHCKIQLFLDLFE